MILQEISGLFSGYGVIPMIALFLGLIFLLVEIFVPGFGVFGILGAIFSAIGIGVRVIIGASVYQILIMLSFAILVVIVAFVILTISARFGFVRRGPMVQQKTSVPVDYAKDNKQFVKMIGKSGFAITSFRPVGKFSFKDKTYEARSTGEFIDKNSKVKVVKVEADTIYIEEEK